MSTRLSDFERDEIATSALEKVGAVIRAIRVLGSFDNLPEDEGQHRAHNDGLYLLGMGEEAVGEALALLDADDKLRMAEADRLRVVA